MADVFISYAREDRSHAEQIARGLQALGLEPFWDTDIPPGQTWADYIEAKLDSAKAVIVLWSEHSTKSQWVREEARIGRDKSKLIPALLDASPAPFGFGEVQAADLSTWRGEAAHNDWRRFSQAVYAAARDGAAAPQLAPQQVFAPAPAASSPDAASDQLSPIDYVRKCLRLYLDGKGRARRAEFWWWMAFFILVLLIAMALDMTLFGYNETTGLVNTQLFFAIAMFGLIAPHISVLSRRFHDIGLSGWLAGGAIALYFLGAALMASYMQGADVIVGAVVLAVLAVTVFPSRPGDNQYGPNPKQV